MKDTVNKQSNDWHVTVSDDCQVIKSWIIYGKPYHEAMKETLQQMELYYKCFRWTMNRI